MSDWAPDLVYPARTRYHAVYGSHDGGFDPHNERWEYWVICSSHPQRHGNLRRLSKRDLIPPDVAIKRGLAPCASSCHESLSRLAGRLWGKDL